MAEEKVGDRDDVDRLVAANRYVVLATADEAGAPWVSPVFFAPVGDDLCWVSSPATRHSANIAVRPAVALTVFDSTVPVGGAEAAYFEADAAPAVDDGIADGLLALNLRLPAVRQLSRDDLLPGGRLAVYRAVVRQRYVLVRGGNRTLGNVVDRTMPV